MTLSQPAPDPAPEPAPDPAPAAPQLRLVCGAGVDPVAMADRLGAALPGAPGAEPLHDDIGPDAAERLVLLYRGYRGWMEAEMEQGAPPARAAEGWQRAARQVLDLLRRDRSRIVLAEASLALAAPDALAAALEGRTEEAAGLAAGAEEAAGPRRPMHDVLAAAVLAGSEPLRRTLAEIEASSLLAPPPLSGADAAAAASAELFAMLAERTQRDGTTARAAEERAMLRSALEEAQHEIAAQRAALDGRHDTEQRLAGLEHERRELLASTSWRVTAPLRGVKLALRRLRR